MESNGDQGICYRQPKTLPQRTAIARDFVERFAYGVPMLVDPMNNPAEEAYAGWPERLYVIDEQGVIAYKGRKGPFGFDPAELEVFLDDWLGQRGRGIPTSTS